MNESFAKKCTILTNENLGRHVVANDDVKTGETILLEQPILLMPGNNEKRCTNCYHITTEFCKSCLIFPLCNLCTHNNNYDCQKLSSMKGNVLVEPLRSYNYIYGIIKCLLLRENLETVKYFKNFVQGECHLEHRRSTKIWNYHNKNTVQPIIRSGLLKCLRDHHELNDDYLHLICALIDVNKFEIRGPDCKPMKGIYLLGGLLSHDCTPNTCIAIDENYRMKIYANQDIIKGQLITNCYTNILLGTVERQRILWESKYFQCHCKRCQDPTELNSHFSSLLCLHCPNKTGHLVRNQRDPEKFHCLKCNYEKSTKEICAFITKWQAEILNAEGNIYELEKILIELSGLLHPQHYLILDIKQNIAAILRSILNDTSIQCPGRQVYIRKIQLCEDILKILNIIMPGISRIKAIVLYELATTTAEFNRLRYREKELNKMELKEILQNMEKIFRDAIRMLLYEPKGTPEGKLVQNMLQELKYLQIDIKMV